MKSDKVVFSCQDEIHMKAIAVFIQKASHYTSRINIYRGDRRANAKSLLGVMSLGIENGVELKLTAEGYDEEEAIKELTAYLSQPNFN
ncbi:HPr family phosphocarrier protein [Mageeibacillus indolicus]|uniref:Phosphocarrier, HPr family n=1 Tax=Mageeibacillus indolicus (strain UPII9-5) TaxID=699246 RepID=D3R296_MAGIU|nr:HPr family phosphocarrier protein [Mageeibacillus indolicus]ADC90422.1 phosphocarrier, HPr family [Mageeibacillus indolicus UPII9-5]KFA57850.1 serine kinase [Mageeibacillus indolicus 0009-5]